MPFKQYSAQTNKHGNIIVCYGTRPRNTYRVIKVGSYDECNKCKGWSLNLAPTTCFAHLHV